MTYSAHPRVGSIGRSRIAHTMLSHRDKITIHLVTGWHSVRVEVSSGGIRPTSGGHSYITSRGCYILHACVLLQTAHTVASVPSDYARMMAGIQSKSCHKVTRIQLLSQRSYIAVNVVLGWRKMQDWIITYWTITARTLTDSISRLRPTVKQHTALY